MANTRDKDLTRIYSYGIDEAARADSVANGTRQINPMDAHGQFRNALTPRGGVAFDTSSGSINWTPSTAGALATDPWSYDIFFRVMATAPATSRGLLGFGSGGNYAVASGLGIYVNSPGALIVEFFAATTGDFRKLTVSSFVTNYAGKVVSLSFVKSLGLIYINGVLITATETTGGTPPVWATSTVATTQGWFGALGTNSFPYEGPIYCATLYNLALSASDVLEIFELGGAVPFRFQFGSQIKVVNSDFSGGVDGWSADFGSVTAPTTVGAIANALKEDSGAATQARIAKTAAAGLGKRFRLVYDTYVPAANTTGRMITWKNNNNAFIGPTPRQPTGDTWTTYSEEFAAVVACSVVKVQMQTAGSSDVITAGDVFYLKNITLTQIGAVVHLPLDDGLGFELQDVSTNRLHALMATTGVSHIAPLYGPARVRTTTNTNGNQQLLGGTVLPALCQIIRVRARAQTNTPTVTFGTASGGSQVVASVALSTTWKDLTIALTGGIVTSASSLWAGSNSTDVVEWDVTWEPLSP